MTTSYTGFQSYVSTAPGPTSPYGRFIAGGAADDLDLDDAQHLMALAMATQDNCQWLGWRVNYLNSIEGSTGNAALTAGITTYNAWDFKGTFVSDGATARFSNAGGVFMFADMTVGQTSTVFVGTNAHGVGKILIDGAGTGAGSNLIAQNGATIQAKLGTNIIVDGTTTTSSLKIQNGAVLSVDSTSTAKFSNIPAATVDPGDDNALSGANIIKCVANFVTDGAGGLNIDGGYNFGSIGLSGTNALITFARALPNNHYCVKGTISTRSGPSKTFVVGAFAKNTAHVEIWACLTLNSSAGGAYVDLTATTDVISFMIEITCPA